MSAWMRQADDGSLVLSLHVQPGAKKTGFAGYYGDAVKIRLAAPPVDGKANAALCAFVAEVCGVPKSAVSLISGETSRTKRIGVVAKADSVERLQAALAESC
ncbi:UPF0235 protein [Betaproteobacteria bacterium]|nr:UPF0235 protein [Betaproteobacteria bacterium]GHT99851.1 UPF0235 protein [Betaproteobacteria bacterium]GHU19049.1 UPF0235 protein [Betaproteobacteria bacterium]